MAGYVRVDTSNNISDGNVIAAADLDNEFDGIQAAFNASTGHNHDGTTGEGAPILVLGPTQDVVVGASAVTPKTTNIVDIGSSSLKYKDLYLAGNASIGGTLAVTGITTLTAQPILSSLTASRAVFTDGSKGLVSNAITGTGNVVMSASPTLTGTITAEALTTSGAVTHNAGTANGVAYLNGSKVLTTGSALTFDGATLSNTGSGDRAKFGTGTRNVYIAGDSGGVSLFDGAGQTGNGWYISGASSYVAGYVSSSEQMRLTSTGLGIGTSSPAYKLDVAGIIKGKQNIYVGRASDNAIIGAISEGTASGFAIESLAGGTDSTLQFKTNGSERARIDSSGNLGIGTSSPATKLDVLGNSTFQGDVNITSATPSLLFSVPSGGLDSRIFNDGSGNFIFSNGTNSATPTERLRLDSSGNLGLGVTPSAWKSDNKAQQVGRGGSVVSNTAVSNLVLGSNYYFDASAQYRYINSEVATRYEQYLGQHQWFTAPSGTAGAAISFTQAMTLDASGNLGVGTSSPSTKLHVSGGPLRVDDTNIMFLNPNYSAGVMAVQGFSNAALAFCTNNTERARIDSSGNLLVGTTSRVSLERFTAVVSGDAQAAAFKNDSATRDTQVVWNASTSGNNQFIGFYTEASITARGSISYSRGAGLVAYNVTSDYRAKDIIGPVVDSGALIDSVPVYMGKMKGATQERPMFIAHETPDYAHTGEKDAVDAEGSPVYQQMDASALVPVMWAELQSLRARVAALEAA